MHGKKRHKQTVCCLLLKTDVNGSSRIKIFKIITKKWMGLEFKAQAAKKFKGKTFAKA
jgi:hypothetical protein